MPDYVGDSRCGRFPIQPTLLVNKEGVPLSYEDGTPTLTAVMLKLLSLSESLDRMLDVVIVGSRAIPRSELQDRHYRTGRVLHRQETPQLPAKNKEEEINF